MKQAKVISTEEMKRLLAIIEAGRHATRNRVAVMLSHLAGLRVGEIASLTVRDGSPSLLPGRHESDRQPWANRNSSPPSATLPACPTDEASLLAAPRPHRDEERVPYFG